MDNMLYDCIFWSGFYLGLEREGGSRGEACLARGLSTDAFSRSIGCPDRGCHRSGFYLRELPDVRYRTPPPGTISCLPWVDTRHDRELKSGGHDVQLPGVVDNMQWEGFSTTKFTDSVAGEKPASPPMSTPADWRVSTLGRYLLEPRYGDIAESKMYRPRIETRRSVGVDIGGPEGFSPTTPR